MKNAALKTLLENMKVEYRQVPIKDDVLYFCRFGDHTFNIMESAGKLSLWKLFVNNEIRKHGETRVAWDSETGRRLEIQYSEDGELCLILEQRCLDDRNLEETILQLVRALVFLSEQIEKKSVK